MILKLPYYAKAALLCIGIYVFISMLSVARGLILPLIFGAVIAILLHPIVVFFEKRKIHKVVAIVVTLLLSIIVIAAAGLFMYSQLSKFSESWPLIVEKFSNLINQTIQWFPGFFDISADKVNEWVVELKVDLLDRSGVVIGQTLLSVGNNLVVIFLIPVYVFLLLLYKTLLIEFIHRVFKSQPQDKIAAMVGETKSIVQHYLVGLVIETVLVAILNSIGLLILGIDYAILIGIIGALLNLIPYIGGLVAIAIPVMIALVTKDSPWFILYVIGVYYAVQLIDNNFIVPKIVASKVKINALFSIIVVLAGGALWGVAGMFLSIPLIAIVKVICDNIEPLKPFGFLLGDTMPTSRFLTIRHPKKPGSTNQ